MIQIRIRSQIEAMMMIIPAMIPITPKRHAPIIAPINPKKIATHIKIQYDPIHKIDVSHPNIPAKAIPNPIPTTIPMRMV